jgi:hypothetical protein
MLSNYSPCPEEGQHRNQERIVKRSLVLVSLCAFAALSGTAFADAFNVSPASSSSQEGTAAPASAAKGNMLISANGTRLGQVYRVGADGSAQIIIDGRMVSVPAASLSMSGGKLTTNLTKSQVLALR